MEPDTALKPWPNPETELPRTRHRRPFWVYAGITLVIVLWLAGVALVAFVVLMVVLFAQVGSNK
jgi:hypothetical protein